jgi:hypothetical protein
MLDETITVPPQGVAVSLKDLEIRPFRAVKDRWTDTAVCRLPSAVCRLPILEPRRCRGT